MRKYKWVIALFLLVMVSSLFAQNQKQNDISVWYIGKHQLGHNGVALKTPKCFLIFDYCFPNSNLPEDSEKDVLNNVKIIVPKEIENENTFVFITHNHDDHYNPVIRKLAEKVKNIHYVIPDCMGRDFQDSKLNKCTDTLSFKDTEKGKEINGLKVYPIFTSENAEGCSYLVLVDETIIAYINPCYTSGEKGTPEEFNKQLPKLIDKRHIDIAFVGSSVDFPEENKPRVIIPVHRIDSIEITEQFDKEFQKVKLEIGAKYTYTGKPSKVSEKPMNLSTAKVLIVIAPQNFRDEEYQVTRTQLEKSSVKITVASSSLDNSDGMLKKAKVKADILLKNAKVVDYDAIIFIGGTGAENYFKDEIAHRLAREAVEKGKILAAICQAPAIFANADILKGKRATADKTEKDTLKEKGALYEDKTVIKDGLIITANGPDAASEFAVVIKETLKAKISESDGLSKKPLETPGELLTQAQIALNNGDIETGKLKFRQILKFYPDSSEATIAKVLLENFSK